MPAVNSGAGRKVGPIVPFLPKNADARGGQSEAGMRVCRQNTRFIGAGNGEAECPKQRSLTRIYRIAVLHSSAFITVRE